MTGEKTGNNSNQPNPGAEAWESFYKKVRDDIEGNYEDDKKFIEKRRPIETTPERDARDLAERTAKRDSELAELDAKDAALEHIQNRTEEEYNKQHFEDFVGARDFNDKTGKARTYVHKDIYPDINKLDPDKDPTPGMPFGERTRRRNDMAVLTEFISKLEGETPKEYSKRIAKVQTKFPRQEGETIEKYRERIAEADQNMSLLGSLVRCSIRDLTIAKKISDEMKNIADMQEHGRFGEEKANAYRREVLENALEEQQELLLRGREQVRQDERAKRLAELREKHEKKDADRRRLEAEEKEKLELRLKEIEKQQQEKRDRIKELDQEPGDLEGDLDGKPLVAINADFSHDKKELARDLAEQDLNEETSQARGLKGRLKKLWKGTLFRKVYQKKYENEYLAGERTIDDNGEQRTVYEYVAGHSAATIRRFVLGAVEDERYIHKKIGKNDGENLTPADEKTQVEVRSAIEKFATAKESEGRSLSDIERQLKEDLGRLAAEARDDGRSGAHNIDNYLQVALLARKRVESHLAIDKVMEGFKVYNADVRDGVRTQAHRDNIDRVINKLESSVIGRFLPAEIIAAAVGITPILTRTGARAVAGITGGIGAASVISGLKERNHITEDRARLLRDLASGESHRRNGAGKDTLRYEERIGGTVYELRAAKDLTSNIDNAIAMEPGKERDDALLRAIAEARVRISFSDAKQKDLIGYSSPTKRGDERLKLDIAVIRAEKALSEEQREVLKTQMNIVQKQVLRDVNEKDKEFKHTRAVIAAKKAGKTAALGIFSFLASQEIAALIDPGKIGILEKADIIKNANSTDAKETVLASGFGLARSRYEVPGSSSAGPSRPIRIRGDNRVAMEQYERAGMTKTEVEAAWTEQGQPTINRIPVEESTAKARVAYDGWADNGTKAFDGNELRTQIVDGKFISNMNGASTMGNQTFNYDELAKAGKIKGYITVGDAKFEVPTTIDSSGNLAWGENGVFTVVGEDGVPATIQAIGENGEKYYRYFEVVVDNNIDADGIQHIIPLATDIGTDSFTGSIMQEIPNVVDHPAIYEFTAPEAVAQAAERIRDISMGGLAFAPETARTGLGGVTRPEEATPGVRTETPSEPTPGQTPAPTPGESPIRTTAPGNPEPTSQDQAPSAPGNTNPTNPETGNNSPTPSGDTTPTSPNINQATEAIGSDVIDSLESFANGDGTLLQNAWDSYSPEDRNRIVNVERLKQSANSSEGRALRDWLGANGYPEFARQTISVAS